MANEQQPHSPHAINFASDQDAWDKASDDFKEHFRQVMKGYGLRSPGTESHYQIPDDEEGDEEHEGQTEGDRQRAQEE